MNELIYQQLARFLDTLPEGFPPSETGADIRLLEKLFTPEEANLAVFLSIEKQDAQSIAKMAGLPLAYVLSLLEGMVQKGLILARQGVNGTLLYQAVPLVVGIYEFQNKNMTKELLDDFYDYWSSTRSRPEVQTIPQMRVIPVGESIKLHPETLPYEKVNELVNSQSRFAVTQCICRHTAKMRGEGCQAPEESCLIFGDWADFYVRTGRGRSISREDVTKILAEADAANLVLQPSNSKSIEFICCCCGCCCGVLGNLKNHPRPADYAANAYIAAFDPVLCEACWTCVDRCQMEALTAGVTEVNFKQYRCIGCGLCVTTCPSGALTLIRKPEIAAPVPDTFDQTWRTISQDQAKYRGN